MNSTLETIFNYQNRVAMAGWVILIALPFWGLGKALVSLIIIALCLSYAYLLVFGKRYDTPDKPPGGNFFSLKGVMRLFEHPRSTLAGWTHFLAFDLMVGLFIVSDAAAYNISHWLLIPILIATLMLGPTGLLLYFLLRLFYSGSSFSLFL